MNHISGHKPVGDIREYRVYGSAYGTGAAAAMMARGGTTPILLRRLRPDYPLRVFVTYWHQKRPESRPSPIQRLLLKDDFPNT